MMVRFLTATEKRLKVQVKGPTTTYTYNTLGKVSSVTDSMNHRTEYNYDGKGRLIAESTCSGGESGKIYSMTTTADRPESFEAGEFENKEQMLI